MTDWSLPAAMVLRDGELILDPSAESWRIASVLALDDPDFYRWGYMRQPLPPERRESWVRDRVFRDQIGNARYYEHEASKAVARNAGYISRGSCLINPPVGGTNMVELFTRRSGLP